MGGGRLNVRIGDIVKLTDELVLSIVEVLTGPVADTDNVGMVKVGRKVVRTGPDGVLTGSFEVLLL